MSLSNPALPPEIAADPQAVEIVRAWISDGQAVITVRPAFDDPVSFGQLLAAITRQAASAYAERGGVTEAAAFAAILQGFAILGVTDAPGGGKPQ